MERISIRHHEYVEIEEIDNFLNDIENVCKHYGLSISHEDEHGIFIIEKYNENTMKWLKNAGINIGYD